MKTVKDEFAENGHDLDTALKVANKYCSVASPSFIGDVWDKPVEELSEKQSEWVNEIKYFTVTFADEC